MFNPIKKLFALTRYVTTIFFSIIHIIFLFIWLKIRENNVVEDLAFTITFSKTLIVIDIIQLVIFLFVGHPRFYQSNANKSVNNIISFIETSINLANAFLFIKVASYAIRGVEGLDAMNVFQKWSALNSALSNLGINGFIVFFMFITIIVCAIKLIKWIIKFIKLLFGKKS